MFAGVVVVAGVSAAVSPQTRAVLRRGLVHGLAGAMNAGEALARAAREAVDEVPEDGQTKASSDH